MLILPLTVPCVVGNVQTAYLGMIPVSSHEYDIDFLNMQILAKKCGILCHGKLQYHRLLWKRWIKGVFKPSNVNQQFKEYVQFTVFMYGHLMFVIPSPHNQMMSMT
jgi:hypothetical protein